MSQDKSVADVTKAATKKAMGRRFSYAPRFGSKPTEDYFSIVYLPFLVTLTIGVCTAS